MKRGMILFLCMALMIVVASVSEGQVRDFRNGDFSVTANTSTAVVAGGYRPGRRYYIAINESQTYIVRHATWPLTGVEANDTTRTEGRGIPLNTNLGAWEDKYNVKQSTWYVIVDGGGTASASPITAVVSGRERD